MSEGLAGGDFCATRLPIRITVLLSRCKGRDFFLNCKTKRFNKMSNRHPVAVI